MSVLPGPGLAYSRLLVAVPPPIAVRSCFWYLEFSAEMQR